MKKISIPILKHSSFLFIPVLIMYLSATGVQTISSDPVYIYLMNGLNYAAGRPIQATDHPGTTLHLYLGNMIKFLSETICDLDDCHVINFTISQSETIAFLSLVPIILLFALILFFSQKSLEKYFKRKWLPVLMFLYTWACLPNALYYSIRIAPEVCLLLFSALCSLLIFIQYNEKGRIITLLNPFIIGAIIGAGIALKITFFPFILMLFALNSWKRFLVSMTCSYLSFMYFIQPIWDTPRFGGFISRVSGVLNHKGYLGDGDKGLIDISSILPNLFKMISESPASLISLLIPIFILNVRKKGFSLLFNKEYRPFIVFWVILCVQFAITVLKTPNARFLIPSLALVPWLFAYLGRDFPTKNRHGRTALALTALFFSLFSLNKIYKEILPEISLSKEIRIVDMLADNKSGCFIYENGSYRGIGNALAVGNIWSAYQYNQNIDEKFSKIILSGVYGHGYMTPGNTKTFYKDELRSIIEEDCLLIKSGSSMDTFQGSPINLIWAGKRNYLYQIAKTRSGRKEVQFK